MGCMSEVLLKMITATRCYGQSVTQRYMQCMLVLLRFTAAEDIALQLELLGYDALTARVRETLIATFLIKPEYTRLLRIHSDIEFASLGQPVCS